MEKFIIRGKNCGLYIDAGCGFQFDSTIAMDFPTWDEAESYRLQSLSFPYSYEVCERTGNGREVPV
jgi:hypothetical protein